MASKNIDALYKEQEKSRRKLYGLLGRLPERRRPVSGKCFSVEDRGAYILERLTLDLNGIERVPAYFIKPKNRKEKTPVVVFNHCHGGMYDLGKDELLKGWPGLKSYPDEFSKLGFSVLAIDAWNFGDRSGRDETVLFKELIWKGQVLWGLMVYDSIKAIDYLATRQDVDTRRIGTIGTSMGSTMAWWLAALDTRVKVCVDICCLTDFESLIETRGLNGHGIYYYVPSLLEHFDTASINALIAPRAHLSLAGNYDILTPPAGLDKIDARLKQRYEQFGATENWVLKRYQVGHRQTPEMQYEAIEFLKKHL